MMKYLWILVILSATISAFGQNAYGPDFLNLHCTTPDPNANTLFGIQPKAGLVPNASANGNIVIYCDASSNTLKVSISGGPYNFLVNTGPGPVVGAIIMTPSTPEGYLSWQPANLTAQTCATNTFTMTGARANTDFLAYQWPTGLPAGLTKDMVISAPDTVTIQLCNPTASTINFSAAFSFGAKVVR